MKVKEQIRQRARETDCINCCFADIRDGVQWECDLGRLAKYKEQGAKIVEDDGVYRILDRNCRAFRPHAWREHREGKSLRELKDEVYDDNKQTFSVVICVEDTHTFEDVLQSIDSVRGTDYVQRLIFTVINNDAVKEQLVEYLVGGETDWKIVVIPPSKKRVRRQFGGSTFQMAVHDAVVNVETPWYTSAKAGFQWNVADFKKLDCHVNNDIGRVGVVDPDKSGNGSIVLTDFHNRKEIGGMYGRPIHIKARALAADIKQDYFFMTREQFQELSVG